MKPRAQILKYCAGNVFDLLRSHDQEFTVGHLVDIRKQIALEEAEEPEP
jgi:hypothetical protein